MTDLIERLRDYRPTLTPDVIIHNDRGALDEAATRLAEQDAKIAAQAREIERLAQERDDAHVVRSKFDDLLRAHGVMQSILREAQDRARVTYSENVRLNGLLDIALETLDGYADPTGYTDNDGEQLPVDADAHPGLLALETATNLRAALKDGGGDDSA